MATIHREFEIDAPPEKAWAALRDVGRINELITFLGEVSVDGDHRTCELGEQGKLDELIVSVDDERRRLAYSIVDSPFKLQHHHASMQVEPNGASGARFVWTTDVKPDGAVPDLSTAIDGAIGSLKETLR
jgi:carbon monoxide dehydrogenase subunit G